MNAIDKKLRNLYLCTVSLAVLTSLYFETIGTIHMGCCFQPELPEVRTILETICIFVTMIFTYTIFKMFNIEYVARKINGDEVSYFKFARLRWLLYTIQLYLCLITYYGFFSTNVVAIVGVCAVMLLFIWPTPERRIRELEITGNKSNREE